MKIIKDPLNMYPDMSFEQFTIMTGIITGVVLNAYGNLNDDNIETSINNGFKFPVNWSKGRAKVSKEGVFQYPNDPDSFSLVEFRLDNEIFRIYPRSIITLVNENGFKWAKCD